MTAAKSHAMRDESVNPLISDIGPKSRRGSDVPIADIVSMRSATHSMPNGSNPIAFYFRMRMAWNSFGYRQSPLEAMAYDAETAFASSTAIFNVEKMVARKLGL